MTLLTVLVFAFCARHYSYSSRDVDIPGRLMWLLPVLAVPLVYTTHFVPGAKSWWWLIRANIALSIALIVCSGKLVNGFLAPEAGPSVGVYGAFAVFCFGMILAALGNAVAGALILAQNKPAFAEWARHHRVPGSVMTGLAAVPIGMGMASCSGLLLGVYVSISNLINR